MSPLSIVSLPVVVRVLVLMLLARNLCAGELIGNQVELSSTIHDGDRYMHVRLLGTLRLSNTPLDGFGATELSGLAWDEDEQVLYAVSDAGYLVHLRPVFAQDRLVNVELIATYPLLSEHDKPLRRYLADAEGLAIEHGDNARTDDTTLLISFEGKPRIDRYTPAGRFLGHVELPAALRQEQNFRCRNCQLESVALDPKLGMLAAPQLPLRNARKGTHSIYDARNRVWTFPSFAPEHCSLVDLTTTGDGRLLALERDYQNVFLPIIFALRRLSFDTENRSGGDLRTDVLAIFDNSHGWSVDNFEGVTRQRDNRYFMVSDDNNSALQSTLLVYFEIVE